MKPVTDATFDRVSLYRKNKIRFDEGAETNTLAACAPQKSFL
jgi:hypothetical protein